MIRTSTHKLPFPGMRPFREQEWDLFFGQEDNVETLVERLGEARFIAVTGESGCGKSSMVKAGLIPSLVGRGRLSSSASSRWRVSESKPGKAPMHNLAAGLLEAGLASGSKDEVVEALCAHSRGLLDVLARAGVPRQRRILIVIDQFEELFRYQRTDGFVERDEAALFVKLLLSAVQDGDTLVYVVLTMRSEYLGDCSNFFGLAEAINEGLYLLPKMNRLQLESAIVEPLTEFDCAIENRLLQHLLNETESAREDGLPLLQHALRRAWENREKRRESNVPLGMEHFVLKQEAKGTLYIEKHLNQHLDEIYGELEKENLAERVGALFKLLGEFDNKARLIRRPTVLTEIRRSIGAPDDELFHVIDKFRDEEKGRSFLVPQRERNDRLLDGSEPLDISHEALLRRWSRCQGWITDESADAEKYRELAGQANRARGKWLLTGRLLDQAQEWWRKVQPTAGWAERYDGQRFRYTSTHDFLVVSGKEAGTQRMLRIAAVCFGLCLIVFVVWGIFDGLKKDKAVADSKRDAALSNLAMVRSEAKATAEAAAKKHVEDLAQQLTDKNTELTSQRERLQSQTKELKVQRDELQKNGKELGAALDAKKKALDAEVDSSDKLRQSLSDLEKANRTAEEQRKAADAVRAQLEKQDQVKRAEIEAKAKKAEIDSLVPGKWTSKDADGNLLPLRNLVSNYVESTHLLPDFAVGGLQAAFLRTFSRAGESDGKKEPVLAVFAKDDKAIALREGPNFGRGTISADGIFFATGGSRGIVRVGTSPEELSPRKVHNFAVTGMGLSTDGKLLVSGSAGGEITTSESSKLIGSHIFARNVRLLKSGVKIVLELSFNYMKGEYPASQIAVSLKPAVRVAFITQSGNLLVGEPGKRSFEINPQKMRVGGSDELRFYTLATNPSSQQIWLANVDQDLGILEEKRFVPKVNVPTVAISAMAWNAAGTRLALAGNQGELFIYDFSGAQPKLLFRLPGHGTTITSLAWGASGKRTILATGSSNGDTETWDLTADPTIQDAVHLFEKLSKEMADGRVPVDQHQSDYEALLQLIDQRVAALKKNSPN